MSGIQSGSVAPPRIALMVGNANITWSNNTTAFNGFALVVLQIPTAPAGTQYATVDYGNLYPGMRLPLFQIIPIIQGQFNTACGVYVNDDLVPPGSSYVTYMYDSTNHQVAGPSSSWTVTSNTPVNPFTAGGALTLTIPSTVQSPTTPDT